MKRHRFDPFAFLFGAVFLTIGLTVATGGSGADAIRPFRSWPAAVILTGLVLVLWTASRVVRSLSGEGAEAVAVEAVAEMVTVEPLAEPEGGRARGRGGRVDRRTRGHRDRHRGARRDSASVAARLGRGSTHPGSLHRGPPRLPDGARRRRPRPALSRARARAACSPADRRAVPARTCRSSLADRLELTGVTGLYPHQARGSRSSPPGATSSWRPAPRAARRSCTTSRSPRRPSTGAAKATALYLFPTKALARDQLRAGPRAQAAAGEGGRLRRRHAARRAAADPHEREPRHDEPGHAPPVAPARPRAMGRLLLPALARRRRRGARLPRGVRLARRDGASAAPPTHRALRRRPTVGPGHRHRRQSGRAGDEAHRPRVRRRRRGRRPERRQAVRPVEPADHRRGDRHAAQRAVARPRGCSRASPRTGSASIGFTRSRRAAELLAEFTRRACRRGIARPREGLPRRLSARGTQEARAPAPGRGAARRRGDERPRARHRHRRARRGGAHGVPGHARQHVAAGRPRRPPRRRLARRPGRAGRPARPVPRAAPGGSVRQAGRGRCDRPDEPVRAGATPAVRGARAAAVPEDARHVLRPGGRAAGERLVAAGDLVERRGCCTTTAPPTPIARSTSAPARATSSAS